MSDENPKMNLIAALDQVTPVDELHREKLEKLRTIIVESGDRIKERVNAARQQTKSLDIGEEPKPRTSEIGEVRKETFRQLSESFVEQNALVEEIAELLKKRKA